MNCKESTLQWEEAFALERCELRESVSFKGGNGSSKGKVWASKRKKKVLLMGECEFQRGK